MREYTQDLSFTELSKIMYPSEESLREEVFVFSLQGDYEDFESSDYAPLETFPSSP